MPGVFTKELVHYMFIRNFRYEEHIFMVPTSSLWAYLTVVNGM